MGLCETWLNRAGLEGRVMNEGPGLKELLNAGPSCLRSGTGGERNPWRLILITLYQRSFTGTKVLKLN